MRRNEHCSALSRESVEAAYLSSIARPNREREQLRYILPPVQLYLRKCSCMSLDGLADSSLLAIQLHRALDLERGRIRRVARDTADSHPLLTRRDAVVDNLAAGEGRMAVEDLLRRGGSVGNGPVVHSGVCDETKVGVGSPPPEDDVLVVNVGLDFLLRLNIEDLQCPASYG